MRYLSHEESEVICRREMLLLLLLRDGAAMALLAGAFCAWRLATELCRQSSVARRQSSG